MGKKEEKESDGLALTPSERRTLKGFYRRHRYRWWYHVLLGLVLLYCLAMIPACLYFAWSLFTGEGEIDGLKQELSADSEQITSRLEPVRAFFDKVNIFGIAWTTVLHGVLLLYIGFRLFNRLRRIRVRGPRAALTVKLANRLIELGELEPLEKK